MTTTTATSPHRESPAIVTELQSHRETMDTFTKAVVVDRVFRIVIIIIIALGNQHPHV